MIPSLISRALDAAAAASWPVDALAVPGGFAAKEADGTRLATTFARVGKAEFRGTTLASPRVMIDNLLVLPDPATAAPVFALERVVVGARVMVLVVDLPLLADCGDVGRLAREARALWAAFPDLPPADDPSPWWTEARSGWDLFTKPRGEDALARSAEASAAAWDLWLRFAVAPHASGSGHEDAIARYLAHHAANFPGRPFLHRAFGEGWTEDFLSFLHSPP